MEEVMLMPIKKTTKQEKEQSRNEMKNLKISMVMIR
jgi:hypothetical protein